MTQPKYRRYPANQLLNGHENLSNRQLSKLLKVSMDTIKRWKQPNPPLISEWDADIYAIRLGKHPGEIWIDWFDIDTPPTSRKQIPNPKTQ